MINDSHIGMKTVFKNTSVQLHVGIHSLPSLTCPGIGLGGISFWGWAVTTMIKSYTVFENTHK